VARHARITLEFSGWRVPFASCRPQAPGPGSTTYSEALVNLITKEGSPSFVFLKKGR
jgi:hypothetical protein